MVTTTEFLASGNGATESHQAIAAQYLATDE
jgi:hypothetical protein